MRRPQDAYSHSFTQDKRKPQKSSTHKRPSLLQSAIGTRSGRKKKCGNCASGFSPRFRRIRKNLSIKAVRSGAGSARFPRKRKKSEQRQKRKSRAQPKARLPKPATRLRRTQEYVPGKVGNNLAKTHFLSKEKIAALLEERKPRSSTTPK